MTINEFNFESVYHIDFYKNSFWNRTFNSRQHSNDSHLRLWIVHWPCGINRSFLCCFVAVLSWQTIPFDFRPQPMILNLNWSVLWVRLVLGSAPGVPWTLHLLHPVLPASASSAPGVSPWNPSAAVPVLRPSASFPLRLCLVPKVSANT